MSRLRIGGSAILLLLALAAVAWSAGTPSSAATATDVYYKTEGLVSGPPAPQLSGDDYPRLNLPSIFSENRLWVWFLAQQHLYLGGFVLGALFLVLLFEHCGLIVRKRETAQRFDDLACQTLRLIVLVLALTAIVGGILLFALLALYPDLTGYLGRTFHYSFLMYGLLFFAFSGTVYLYYHTWQWMQARWKVLHAVIGLVANLVGLVFLMLANSWSTFMMSPAGVDQAGHFLGNQWHLLHNALWNPLNVHRFFGNLVFASGVLGAYAAYGALTASNHEDRASYDWRGSVMFITMVLALFTIPFGGYWLLREIYGYRQQMGITLLGGLLAWLNILVVSLMGLLFLGVNYYLWQKIGSEEDAARYRSHVKYVLFLLIASILVYITPHTLIITPDELAAMRGQQHPIVGNFGVESAKQPAVNIMMLVTGWSLLMMLRSRYKIGEQRHTVSDGAIDGLFVAGAMNIIWLGIYGYYIPANVRVGLSVPMVMSTLSVVVMGSVLTVRRVRRLTPMSPSSWGRLSTRGHVALFSIAVTVSWLMGLGGYMRSAVRLFWHVMEISRDTSPWGFTHTIGFATNMITFNVLFFWGIFLLLFWLSKSSMRSTP